MESEQLRLYKHFVETKQLERAEEILKVYPHFKEDKKEVKTTSSKKVK